MEPAAKLHLYSFKSLYSERTGKTISGELPVAQRWLQGAISTALWQTVFAEIPLRSFLGRRFMFQAVTEKSTVELWNTGSSVVEMQKFLC